MRSRRGGKYGGEMREKEQEKVKVSDRLKGWFFRYSFASDTISSFSVFRDIVSHSLQVIGTMYMKKFVYDKKARPRPTW